MPREGTGNSKVAANRKVYELYLSKNVQLNVRGESKDMPAKQRLKSFEKISQQNSENAEGSNLDKCTNKSDQVIWSIWHSQEMMSATDMGQGRQLDTVSKRKGNHTSKKGSQCAGDETDVHKKCEITSPPATIAQVQAKQYNMKILFRKTGESNVTCKENMRITGGSIHDHESVIRVGEG
jgi:hypothetical protein